MVLNGVNYGGSSNSTIGAFLSFAGPTISPALLSATNLTVTDPFTMTGTLNVYEGTSHVNPGPLLLSLNLVGSGTATAQFSMNPTSPGQQPIFQAQSVTYSFSSAASPTPEPASLWLLGIGVVGAAVRRRFAF